MQPPYSFSPHYLGVDVDNNSIRFVETLYQKKGYQFHHCTTYPCQTDKSFYPLVFPFKTKNIVLSLPDAHVLTKKFIVGTKLSYKEKKDYLAFEMEKVASCSKDEFYLDFKIIKNLPNHRQEVNCVAVRAHMIESLRTIFNDTPFTIKKITLDSEIADFYPENVAVEYQKAAALGIAGFEKNVLNFLRTREEKGAIKDNFKKIGSAFILMLASVFVFSFFYSENKPAKVVQPIKYEKKIIKKPIKKQVSEMRIIPIANTPYVSLNFQDTAVRTVLQLLAQFAHQNIMIDEAVKGEMTLHIEKVQWEKALSIILKAHGLESRKMDGVLFIAPVDVMIQWDKHEKDNQDAMAALQPLGIESIVLRYADANELIKTLQNPGGALLSERGHMSVDKRTNSLLIQDTHEKIRTIKEMIQSLDMPVKQVLIEARIVTVNRDFEKDLGIAFGTSEDNTSTDSLNGLNELNVDFEAVSALGNTPASIGIALAKLGGGVLLDLELSALESEGEAKVISSPRLVTSNQQPAFIESGEEIPYQESTLSGATAVSFKKAVLRLKVTPQITSNNKVLMALNINQDMPNGILVNGVPEVMTKEIQTRVLVNNGETLVLGGIYRQDKSQSVERIPFLSDVPGIGSIFQRKTDKIIYEELLIFITPKIINEAL